MKFKHFLIVGVLLAVLAWTWLVPVRAELRSGRVGDDVYILILTIIEDPDPIPSISWELIGEWEGGGGKPLNPGGDARGDGRPDVAIDPSTGWPLVSWAYWAGTDYDIAYSEWEGEDWSDIAFITADVENQLDPRSHIDDAGRVRTVWWESVQAGKIYLAVREQGGTAWSPAQLVQQPGRRPSVVPDGDDLLVAFEVDGPQLTQRVKVLTLLAGGGSHEETLATTDRLDCLDVIVHEAGGVFWADWKHSDQLFAYSVRGAEGWGDPVTLPWTDHSWLGEEELRQIIRSEVLSP